MKTNSAMDVAENDDLRSEFMRRLLAEPSVAPEIEGGHMPPRLLVQFWDDASAVPDDVQSCMASWDQLIRAGFERMLFDDNSARKFVEDHFSARHVRAFNRCTHPAMRADYFRLCFMMRVGGLYVDVDDEYQGTDIQPLLCTGRLQLQALCYDTESDSMVNAKDALADTAGKKIFYVNNNPIMAAPGHPVIARALERSTSLVLAAPASSRDIQSLTGPGNLTASLTTHVIKQVADGEVRDRDFDLLTNWHLVAVSKWPLGYRSDGRNWRNWMRGDEIGRS
jgi:mannosyltransferase OCH1-like enzyme